jgi:phosphoribosylformylglycinamidine synthase
MTLVVEPKHWEALSELAQHMEVELSDIGQFTNSGFLDIRFGEQKVALLEMHFLHEGTPKKVLEAVWAGVEQAEPQPTAFESVDFNQTLLQLMGSWNICSKEAIIRRYDHEVKGRTLIKPLMGKRGKAPQDAALVIGKPMRPLPYPMAFCPDMGILMLMKCPKGHSMRRCDKS